MERGDFKVILSSTSIEAPTSLKNCLLGLIDKIQVSSPPSFFRQDYEKKQSWSREIFYLLLKDWQMIKGDLRI